MLTSAGSGAISPISSAKSYYTMRTHNTAAKATVPAKYDSVSLSENEGGSRFQKELLSRISQEVRTTTTTGDIQALRQAVLDGTYTPNPHAIAAGMLLLGE